MLEHDGVSAWFLIFYHGLSVESGREQRTLAGMHRTSLDLLQEWLGRPRRKPLVLRGARQVGKSTLVRLFAQASGMALVEVDLERHRDLDRVFATLDLERILPNLEAVAGRRLGADALLFLDEIQATPHAVAALRYFYEERPEIPVIAAGSLLEFALADHAFSMPVGRIEYLHLGPMSFSEFLMAVDPPSLEFLEALDPWGCLPEKAHQRLLKRQREFMLVGGMPEAVDVFRATRSVRDTAAVQNSICSTCQDDFAKYARHKDLADLQALFRSVPRTIGNKIKYVHLLPDARSGHVKALLRLLAMARVITLVTRSDCGGLPLSAGADPRFAKLLFLDVGLVSRLLGADWLDLDQLREQALVNEGPLAEQFIGQHLHWEPQVMPELHYWATESRTGNAELDFVVARGRMMVPVEVKSGQSGTLKSLHCFMFRKQLDTALRFDLQPPSVQTVETSVPAPDGQQSVSYRLFSLPLYAVERLPALLDTLRAQ